MGRRSIPSTTLAATVRRYFGLTQTELGQLLHLTRGQVAHVEAGRHLFAPATEQPLLALATALPAPPDPEGPPPTWPRPMPPHWPPASTTASTTPASCAAS